MRISFSLVSLVVIASILSALSAGDLIQPASVDPGRFTGKSVARVIEEWGRPASVTCVEEPGLFAEYGVYEVQYWDYSFPRRRVTVIDHRVVAVHDFGVIHLAYRYRYPPGALDG